MTEKVRLRFKSLGSQLMIEKMIHKSQKRLNPKLFESEPKPHNATLCNNFDVASYVCFQKIKGIAILAMF